MFLAGDIGGSKIYLGLFDKSKCIREAKFNSLDFSSLKEVLKGFLKGEIIKASAFGVAGPVFNGKCKLTNLPWFIDSKELEKELKSPVFLLNDLEAHAYGILKEKDFYILNKGKEKKGNKALIIAGSGLGEAVLYWDGKKFNPFATEGGHVDFAPRNREEIELFLYLKKKLGHVSYEKVVSGPAISLIYEFLTGEKRRAEEISISKDRKCKKAINLFISLYGAEAGNAALKFLAIGGVYIGGNIAVSLIDRTKKGLFLKSFLDKGNFSLLLSKIPIKVALNPRTALLGAFYYLKRVAYLKIKLKLKK